jgi:NADPH:quinone reductase-like Zn-dependent oxidoreductase
VRALVQSSYGPPDQLELANLEPPEVGEGQVLVQVAAAGVDRGAWHLLAGRPYLLRFMGHGLLAPKIPVPGSDLAGTVVAVGDGVTRFSPGDEVYGTCRGSFAELATAREDRLAPKPAKLSFAEAAVLPYAGYVSLQAVRDHARIRPGQSVLVVGASGAVGTVAIQIARAFGAEVTAVCSTAHVDLVRRLGAHHVVDYTRHELDLGTPCYDVVLDTGGNRPLSLLRRVLAPDGTLVIIGGEGGGRWAGGVHRQLGAQLLSPFVRHRLGTFVARENADDLLVLNELVELGALTPVVGRSYHLTAAAQALRDVAAGAGGRRRVVVP